MNEDIFLGLTPKFDLTSNGYEGGIVYSPTMVKLNIEKDNNRTFKEYISSPVLEDFASANA